LRLSTFVTFSLELLLPASLVAGSVLRNWQKILASEEASYNTGESIAMFHIETAFTPRSESFDSRFDSLGTIV
jgi:hypothetical protein